MVKYESFFIKYPRQGMELFIKVLKHVEMVM